ncbi:MAG: HAD-IA family hydrolase [archaeon]
MNQQKAAIFDLNGILIQSPLLSERIRQDYGVNKEEFLPVLSEIMDEVRRPGARAMYDYWKPHLARWKIPLDQEAFLHYWFSAEKENKEMTRYALSLKKKGWKIFIFSNNFRERAAYYQANFRFIDDFDEVFYSWKTGFVKPDERGLAQILSKYKLEPGNCYYFDDSEKNVALALKMGLHASKFESLAATKRILEG